VDFAAINNWGTRNVQVVHDGLLPDDQTIIDLSTLTLLKYLCDTNGFTTLFTFEDKNKAWNNQNTRKLTGKEKQENIK
jgi:hypothetical protein